MRQPQLTVPHSAAKVLFGGNVNHWINRLLFLDALSWVSRGRIAVPLTRYIMVDIDDVFVGKNRFLPEDVSALIKSQDHLQESVPGFRYNLGFSGGYFHHSEIPEELAGDDAIMRNKDKFWDELYKNRSSGKTDSQ